MKILFALFLYLMIISAIFAEVQPIGRWGKVNSKTFSSYRTDEFCASS
ncbi:MAG: hypothetical protein OXT74_05380 [Candidatus Poribacteria bacterium]|nr:hypothetical protein [Candidatus Poribacteria bacterium]